MLILVTILINDGVEIEGSDERRVTSDERGCQVARVEKKRPQMGEREVEAEARRAEELEAALVESGGGFWI